MVRLEVLGQRGDLLRENRNLNLARTRITVMALKLALDGSVVNFHFFWSFFSFTTHWEVRPCQRHTLSPESPRGRDNLLRQSQIVLYYIKNAASGARAKKKTAAKGHGLLFGCYATLVS